MSVTIITGTDTNVGKTITTAALVATCGHAGGRAYVVKPAQTGVIAEPSDLAEVRRLVGEVPGHVGVELREALAPAIAARWEGVRLPSLASHVRHIAESAQEFDEIYVEGAGGIRVGLGEDFDLLDLADGLREVVLDPEFVVVTRCDLGTLNHTILTVDVIEQRGHRVKGLVVGSVPEEPDLAQQANLTELANVTGRPVLAAIPEGVGQLSVDDFLARAQSWFVDQPTCK